MISSKLFLLLAIFAAYCHGGGLNPKKIVCYYDSKSHFRQGEAKFQPNDLEKALETCTHLIYGYAAINEATSKLIPLNEHFDVIQNNYGKVTDLKRRFPRVKFLLSVGGNADVSGEDSDKNLKYRTLLESSTSRLAFVNSAYTLIKAYGFDGVDLAWEFPETKPKKIRSTLGKFWHKLKHTVGAVTVVDENAEEHRSQFTSLVREMKNALKGENLLLSLTVLPNVNSTVYYDPRLLAPHLDFVNLLAFDFYTPIRNPKEADYPAPLYELTDRRSDENVHAQVQYWLLNGCPADKIVLGIPTYGRTWTMDGDSDKNGVPPLHIDGPGEAGPFTKDAGLLSYPEVCLKVGPQYNARLPEMQRFKIVLDSSKRKGTYAYRVPNEDNNIVGIWIGYDDEQTVANKAAYARAKNLGGIAIYDLTLDDFKGQCGADKYDILRAAVNGL